MKLSNSFHTVSPDKPRWEKTDDGFLRCKARVLAERVMPYTREELSNLPEDLNVGSEIRMYVSRDSMASAESIRSLEGAIVVAGDHNWCDPEVIKQYGVGHVAGTPVMDGPYLVCDLVITDKQAMEDIEEEKIGEISAAYTADSLFEAGDFDGNEYDARQTQLRYNHIAVIPAGHGRAGADVRIINKKAKENDMAEEKTVRVQLRNSKRMLNTDEEGAAALAEEEKLANEESETSGKSLEEAMAKAEEATAARDAAQAELEEVKGELSVYKEKLDELLSEETISAAAEEMVEEQGEAEEILENAAVCNEKGEEDEEEKEKVLNSIKKMRGEALHRTVLSAIGVKLENMSPDGLRGAFKAQHQIMNSTKGRRHVAGARMQNRMVPGKDTPGTGQPVQRTSMEKLGFAKK